MNWFGLILELRQSTGTKFLAFSFYPNKSDTLCMSSVTLGTVSLDGM